MEPQGSGTPIPVEEDDGKVKKPAAKRIRFGLCEQISKFEALKKRNDVKEIIKDLDKGKLNGNGKHHVSEVDSQPCIMRMAQKVGLKAGWALDLIQADPDDRLPLDFSQQAKREKALRKLKEE